MIPPKYVATKDLFQALIRAKRSFRCDELQEAPEPLGAAPEELAPASTRESFYED
jgi:hypothetical protein